LGNKQRAERAIAPPEFSQEQQMRAFDRRARLRMAAPICGPYEKAQAKRGDAGRSLLRKYPGDIG